MPEIIAKKWAQRFSDLGVPATAELDITSDSYILLTLQNTRIYQQYHAEAIYHLITNNQRMESALCK